MQQGIKYTGVFVYIKSIQHTLTMRCDDIHLIHTKILDIPYIYTNDLNTFVYIYDWHKYIHVEFSRCFVSCHWQYIFYIHIYIYVCMYGCTLYSIHVNLNVAHQKTLSLNSFGFQYVTYCVQWQYFKPEKMSMRACTHGALVSSYVDWPILRLQNKRAYLIIDKRSRKKIKYRYIYL